MDVHISVIADFKTACPHIDVIDWCMSGHHFVMNRALDVPEVINHATWTNIHPTQIARFQAHYDHFLKQFDLFIVAYSSVFAMVFEKYGKPIIMMNATRYDVPFCWTKQMEMLETYNTCLRRLHSSGQLTIVSNNYADRAYLHAATGIQSEVLPSLCLYTRAKYTPTSDQFVVYHGPKLDHPLIAEKPNGHSWQQIANYKGLISFPYEISLMSLFEYFTAGMPMFFPSKTYWKAHPAIQSVGAYWGKGNLPPRLKEFENPDVWIDLSDIYHTFVSPNVRYFDSTEHLFQLLETFEYVPEDREPYIQRICNRWKEIVAAAQKYTPAPKPYPLLLNLRQGLE